MGCVVACVWVWVCVSVVVDIVCVGVWLRVVVCVCVVCACAMLLRVFCVVGVLCWRRFCETTHGETTTRVSGGSRAGAGEHGRGAEQNDGAAEQRR